jgi:hypothetical protein
MTKHEEHVVLELLKINSIYNEKLGAIVSFATKNQLAFMLGFSLKKIENIYLQLQKTGKIARNDEMIIIAGE